MSSILAQVANQKLQEILIEIWNHNIDVNKGCVQVAELVNNLNRAIALEQKLISRFYDK